MTIAEAQREIRSVYLGGSIGQLVAGSLWLLSAALSTRVGIRQGIIALVVGGMFIFPLTMLVLRLAGRRASLSRENPLGSLATQVALTVSLTLPVVGGAALHNIYWFYRGCMVIVGAHYLPFIHLYGMKAYGLLAAILLAGGFYFGLRMPHEFALGGWFTGAMLVFFGATLATISARRESRGDSG